QVLADPTGRRRRRLAIAGRVATAALGFWLIVLFLGGLGLQPLAGLPIVGNLGTVAVAPPELPARVRTAVTKHTTVAPATAPAAAETTPNGKSTSPTSKTTRPKTNPSKTAPGQTRTPPGQTKTESGPPASTPGTTPGSKGKGNDKAKGKVKTP
ncbi:MAG: hypothetical protein Q7J25_00860, partial [Vicinamibacterales bacterium]|nr:hypothetical protein [Vicinamibacterales bacterium]